MIDVPDLMNMLAKQRKLYHSEADLQHAFAWEVRSCFKNSTVRLERPLSTNGKKLHLDLFIQLPDGPSAAIELKYKTRKLTVELEGETFNLASHSAQDIGRYDFIKDIARLEYIVSSLENFVGYAIMLTNDSAYWKSRPVSTKVDKEFRLTEGRILTGPIAWDEKASDGTKKNREKPLRLIGEYKLHWQDFSVANSAAAYGQFRYLSVLVVPKRI